MWHLGVTAAGLIDFLCCGGVLETRSLLELELILLTMT